MSARPFRAGSVTPVLPAPRTLALGAVTLGIVALGMWGIVARPAESPVAHPAEAIDVPGGRLLVEQVWPEVMAHAMPGMAVSDEVPEGYRRFAIEVLVEATDSHGLRYRAADLSVLGPGLVPVQPIRAQPEMAVVPAGSRLAARAVFDVPADAVDLRLGVLGAGTTIPIQALVPASGDHELRSDHYDAP